MEKMTKSKFLSALAERTGTSKKEASDAWDAVCAIAAEQAEGAGVITLPGLVKFTVKDIPASPERKGIHPFTKEPHTFPAKPASKRLKATIPKSFKDKVLG